MPKTAEQLRQEQIARLKAWRRTYLAEQRAKQEAELKARREAAARSRSANRQPPARTWRIGRTIMWEPPATADKERPVGYWISEQLPDGGWTAHGDYLPATAREAQLYGDGPAKVETIYSQQALGECYYGETVETTPGEPWWLVSRVPLLRLRARPERNGSSTLAPRAGGVRPGRSEARPRQPAARRAARPAHDRGRGAELRRQGFGATAGRRSSRCCVVSRGESAPSTSTAEPAPGADS